MALFGKVPVPEEPRPPEPDYPALVDRELRVAAGAAAAERMWAEIMRDYAIEAKRQRYIRWRR